MRDRGAPKKWSNGGGPARLAGFPVRNYPVRTIAEWKHLGGWLRGRDKGGRMAEERAPEQGGSFPDALFVGAAGARFGFRMAATGSNAAIRKIPRGSTVRPWRRGARLCVTSRISLEATWDPGGWRSAGDVDRVFSGVAYEEVVPGMRAAISRGSSLLDIGSPSRTRSPAPLWSMRASSFCCAEARRAMGAIVLLARWPR